MSSVSISKCNKTGVSLPTEVEIFDFLESIQSTSDFFELHCEIHVGTLFMCEWFSLL